MSTKEPNGSKINTKIVLSMVFALLLLLIGTMLRGASTGATVMLDDIKANAHDIVEVSKEVAEVKTKVVKNETEIGHVKELVKEVRDDIKDIKKFVIGTN